MDKMYKTLQVDIDDPVLVKIKPLSVNKAWKGRRFKTDDYLVFQDMMNSSKG
jgi:hypothetical protein